MKFATCYFLGILFFAHDITKGPLGNIQPQLPAELRVAHESAAEAGAPLKEIVIRINLVWIKLYGKRNSDKSAATTRLFNKPGWNQCPPTSY